MSRCCVCARMHHFGAQYRALVVSLTAQLEAARRAACENNWVGADRHGTGVGAGQQQTHLQQLQQQQLHLQQVQRRSEPLAPWSAPRPRPSSEPPLAPWSAPRGDWVYPAVLVPPPPSSSGMATAAHERAPNRRGAPAERAEQQWHTRPSARAGQWLERPSTTRMHDDDDVGGLPSERSDYLGERRRRPTPDRAERGGEYISPARAADGALEPNVSAGPHFVNAK
jgi:hypothetical protein